MIGAETARELYNEALTNFFKYLRGKPITFFTDAETYPFIRKIANDTTDIQVRDFNHFPIFQDLSVAEWKEHMEMDTEKYHTWQLGAIWASKSYFVKETAELHPEENWFVWVDSGCIRTPAWEPHLEDFTTRDMILTRPGVYLQLLRPLPTSPDLIEFHPTEKYIAGAIIAFHREYIHQYIDEYVKIFKEYTAAKKPAICDQFVMTTAAQRFKWIHAIQPRIKAVPDMWFFFLAVL